MANEPSNGGCRVSEVELPRGVRGIRLENDQLATTVLVDKGADIYELTFKPHGVDALWKSPWGLRKPGGGVQTASDSATGWLEAYAGGWQEIFPSGGGPCTYKGVELNFHGEASTVAWDYTIHHDDEAAELRLSTRLARSPFLIKRTMRVEPDQPTLIIRERITNQGGEALDYMWGHHPAYGAPLLSGGTQIDTNARRITADDLLDGPANPLTPGQCSSWPHGVRDGRQVDLSSVPGSDSRRQVLAYLDEFDGDHGWYGLTNPEIGCGVGLVWPTAVFPYAWFWQELEATAGFPWYQAVRVMAIEPFSSIPGQGLVAVMEKTRSHRTLAAGATVEAELRAVLYASSTGVESITPDGTVRVRKN